MFRSCVLAAVVVVAGLASAPALRADGDVPFKGTWTGETVAADFSAFPPIVGVIAAGGGQFTHLGQSTMVSPHTTDVFTGETLGDQIFTAANGDTLTAYCAGFATPDLSTGIVSGTLDCEVTSGTGRFADATGSYTFALVATPLTDGRPGYATVAQIDGSINY